MEYEITAPDGRRFIVTAPQGATQEQVLSYAQQNFQPQPAREPDTSLAQNAGVVSRAASPPAVAAAAGALAGSRFGTLGTRAGAALGPLVLGAADIGATGYNVVAPRFGLPRVSTPTELIQGTLEAGGIGRAPETSGQRILSDVAGGASTAGAQAAAFNVLRRRLGATAAQNMMPGANVISQRPASIVETLAAQPVAQTGAGAGGAALPSAVREFTETEQDPLTNLALSLAGSVLGGRATAQTGNIARSVGQTAERVFTPSGRDLRGQAQRAFTQADNANVQYDPTAANTFSGNLRARIENEGYKIGQNTDPTINKTLIRLDNASQPLTFTELHVLRNDLSDARRILSGSPQPGDRRQARLVGDVIRQLDDFTLNPPPTAIVGGNAGVVRQAVTDARTAWSRMAKSNEIEDAVFNASRSATAVNSGRLDEAIRAEFAKLEKDIRNGKSFGYTPEELANISRIASGEARGPVIKALSNLRPGLDARGVMAGLTPGGAAYYGYHAGDPSLMLAAAAVPAVGYAARGARNMMAEQAAANLAAGMRRGDVTAPMAARPVPMLSPTLQQMLYQSDPANAFVR